MYIKNIKIKSYYTYNIPVHTELLIQINTYVNKYINIQKCSFIKLHIHIIALHIYKNLRNITIDQTCQYTYIHKLHILCTFNAYIHIISSTSYITQEFKLLHTILQHLYVYMSLFPVYLYNITKNHTTL